MNKLILVWLLLVVGCHSPAELLDLCIKACSASQQTMENVKIDGNKVKCTCKKLSSEVNYNE